MAAYGGLFAAARGAVTGERGNGLPGPGGYVHGAAGAAHEAAQQERIAAVAAYRERLRAALEAGTDGPLRPG